MMKFKQFVAEQDNLEERLVRKGVVATYATQGKRHGDKAIQHYNNTKTAFTSSLNKSSTDEKVDSLIKVILAMNDGLISTRHQIGSVSAQITALSVL